MRLYKENLSCLRLQIHLHSRIVLHVLMIRKVTAYKCYYAILPYYNSILNFQKIYYGLVIST